MKPIAISGSVRGSEVCLRTAYLRALNSVGLRGVLLPPQELADDELLALLGHCGGLVLAGGGDLHPCLWGEEPITGLGEVDATRDEWEIHLVGAAVALNLPILGICRGMQILNVFFGGTLWQDLQARPMGQSRVLHQQTATSDTAWHSVRLNPAMQGLYGQDTIWVNSLHHQGIKTLGSGVLPAAWAKDGLVEAILLSELEFCVGVQWHPEYLQGEKPLWSAFAAACEK